MDSMEARVVAIKDSDKDGDTVGLVVTTTDKDGNSTTTEPLLTADSLEHLRPLVVQFGQAFEYPVLTSDEYDTLKGSGNYPEGPMGPLGEEPADREARLARDEERADEPRSPSEGSVVPATPDSMVTPPGDINERAAVENKTDPANDPDAAVEDESDKAAKDKKKR
jgi:hypothetical protein